MKGDCYLFWLAMTSGFMFWFFGVWLNVEPWDSPYALLVIIILCAIHGFFGKKKPWLWPLGMFFGELLAGAVNFLKNSLFYSGGGADMFFPFGVVFLIPLLVPGFVGSFVGYGIGKSVDWVKGEKF